MQRGMGSAAGAGSSSGRSKMETLKVHWLGDKGVSLVSRDIFLHLLRYSAL